MASDDFTRLVDTQYTPLFRFALSLAKNSADAADLTQQTFLVWAKRGHGLRDDRKAKAWLFTTLYREFLRGCRRAQRVEALEDLGSFEADLSAPDTEPFSVGQGSIVPEAMLEIEEVYRVPLTLFYLQEFSYKEIAEMLEIPIGTVMSRLARGKTQLRVVLARKKARACPKIAASETP